MEFVTLDPLDAASVRAQLAAVRPHGYLLNWPDLGPFVSGELADAAERLVIVTYCGQSLEPSFYVDNLDLAALRDRGIVVTTAPGAEFAVAESALAFLFAFELGVVPANTARKRDRASAVGTGRRPGLVGSTLGIVGMGAIGQRVAELATACGMQVRYASRTRRPALEDDLGATYHRLSELFASCDHVSVHLPMGPGEGAIDSDVLAHARGVTLVNTTSIAPVIDPEALLLALEQGWVARFAMEGRYREPYDRRLRAYGDDRVLLRPPYSSYDTPFAEHVGWRRYLESLAALRDGADVPHQLRTGTA